MMGHPTRVLIRNTSQRRQSAVETARVLTEWAERRDRDHPLGYQDTLAEIQVNREGRSIALLVVNEADAAELRRLLLGDAEASS